MKKILFLSLAFIFIAGIVNAKQLWEYGSFEQRAEKAYEIGLVKNVQNYMGSRGVNLKLLEHYEKEGSMLGGSADPMQPSGINVNIRESLVSGASRSATTLVIDPIITVDGHYIEFADFNSTKVYAKLNQGTSNEEIFYFTGMTTSTATYTLTGCVWGCNFYNTTCDVDANKKRHFSGAELIFSTDFHFINENYVSLNTDQTIDSTKTFTEFPLFATSTTLPDADGELATKYYVDTVGAGGFTSANASTTKGLEVYGTSPETVGINASTTKGLAFDNDGALYFKASSTGNLAWDSGELYFDGADGGTFAGDFTYTGSTTMEDLEIDGKDVFENLSKFGGSGADGALSVTSGTTTLDANSANVLVKNYSSINIATGTELTISNPATAGTILILKSAGNCTIDGKINLEGMGASAKTTGYGILDNSSHFGADGEDGADSGAVAGGAGGGIFANKFLYLTPNTNFLYRKFINVVTGSGGGAGGTDYSGILAGGAGGRGGGGIIIECAGSLTFSSGSEINVNGADGSNGLSTRETGSGGGGGGSAGMALVIYNTLVSNAGTINAKGGAGGNGGDNIVSGDSDTGGGGGAGGGSYTSAGKNGGAGGGNSEDGADGTNTNNASGAGGGGGAGTSGVGKTGGTGGTQGATDANHYAVIQNTVF